MNYCLILNRKMMKTGNFFIAIVLAAGIFLPPAKKKKHQNRKLFRLNWDTTTVKPVTSGLTCILMQKFWRRVKLTG
jgi:hypothetical protein